MALCIYHGNCADGFSAAWAIWKAHPDWEFYPAVHQDPPPDVAGKDVVLVDFSYKYDVLTEMSFRASSLLVLDHHKSAAEDLARLPPVKSQVDWSGPVRGWCYGQNMPHVGALFDMDRSGAMIAWDFFHPGEEPPPLLWHIQDRDLWQFKLSGTREIQAAVFSYPYDFEVWDGLMKADPERLFQEGVGIERKHHKDVAELVAVCRRKLVIGGHLVPAASLPYTLTSDAANLMCQPVDEGLAGSWVPPFAACYWDTPAGRVFSLRSDDAWGAVDVSEVAKMYGGGGHRNAAGFRVSIADAAAFEVCDQ